MNSSLRIRLLRALVLLAGTACATLILALGLSDGKQLNSVSLLGVQSAFLLVVAGLSLLGIAASAFFSNWLRASRTLRLLFLVPAALFPLNDFFPMLSGGELDRHLIPALAMSATVAAVIALAVASSWLPTFVAPSHREHA